MTHEDLRDRARAASNAYDRAVWACETALESHRADRTEDSLDALALAVEAKHAAYSARSKSTRAIREANIPREP